jgi:hypothetical protein
MTKSKVTSTHSFACLRGVDPAQRRWAVTLVVSWCLFMAPPGAVKAHDVNHPEFDDWYSGLTRPGTTASCCNVSDCHRTEAEYRADGWWARIGRPVYRSNAAGKPYVADWVLLDFIHIPEDKILRQHDNPTGEAVICHSTPILIGIQPVILYCFVPPSEG